MPVSDQTLTVALWVGGIAATATGGGVALLLATVKAQGQTLGEVVTEVQTIRTALTGLDGQNGLASEVRGLRSRVHALGDEQHGALARLAVVEARQRERDREER